MSVRMTLSDLEKQDTAGQIFRADLANYARIPYDLKQIRHLNAHGSGAYF